ncbi:hypothetical protein [Nostoc sp.]|uniref:hypothetical protein n=1 Tax=Nostoc sp. TaxID=1180 RepID=UPI002FFB0852
MRSPYSPSPKGDALAFGHPTAGVPIGAASRKEGYEVKESQRLRLQLLETLREHSTALRTLREDLRQRNDILYLISPSYL